MKEFGGIVEMIAHLAIMDLETTLALHKGLKKCAAAIEKTSKEEIGFYQPSVEYFPAWAELADSTKADRVNLGFTENDPLLRSGELRDSISHEMHGLEACVGSTSEVMVYQELGTEKMPPRPVLGPAAIRNKKLITQTLGHAAVKGLLYGSGITVTHLLE